MGQKDITEKTLADYNDVFADIVNVLLFQGKQIVSPDNLENAKDKSQYKAEHAIHEEERDVSKIMKHHHIKIAMLGFEHQTKEDADEPIRIIGYDGVSYRSQLLHNQKERFPVVTLVLYFGTKHWNKGTSLYDVLPITEEWKPYVNDYRINLFEIAFLSPEQVNLFQSDFRIVADYFVQLRTNRDYKPSNIVIRHVDAVLKLMSVLTEDDRFEQAAQNTGKDRNERRDTTMCEVLDKIEAHGIATGREEGISVGREEGARETIQALQLISNGCTTLESLLNHGISTEVAEQVIQTIS